MKWLIIIAGFVVLSLGVSADEICGKFYEGGKECIFYPVTVDKAGCIAKGDMAFYLGNKFCCCPKPRRVAEIDASVKISEDEYYTARSELVMCRAYVMDAGPMAALVTCKAEEERLLEVLAQLPAFRDEAKRRRDVAQKDFDNRPPSLLPPPPPMPTGIEEVIMVVHPLPRVRWTPAGFSALRGNAWSPLPGNGVVCYQR